MLITILDLHSPSEPLLVTKEDDIVHDKANKTNGKKIKDKPTFFLGVPPGHTMAKMHKQSVRTVPSNLKLGATSLLRLGGPSAKARLGGGSLDHLMEAKH